MTACVPYQRDTKIRYHLSINKETFDVHIDETEIRPTGCVECYTYYCMTSQVLVGIVCGLVCPIGLFGWIGINYLSRSCWMNSCRGCCFCVDGCFSNRDDAYLCLCPCLQVLP